MTAAQALLPTGSATLAAEEGALFFALGQDPMCMAGTDGYFKRVNPAFSATLGWTAEELLSRPYVEFVHPDDRDATVAEATMSGGGAPTLHFENRYRHREGTWRWLSWRATPVVSTGLVYAVARDVTAQKAAEAALRVSEARFRALSEHGSDLVCILAADGTTLYGSPSYTRVLGAPLEVLHRVAGSPLAAIHPDDQGKVHGALVACVEEGQAAAAVTCRHRHADGSWRTLECVATNCLADPAIGGIVVTSRDVTDREAAEEAVRASEQGLQTVIGNAPIVLTATDASGTITFSAGRGLAAIGRAEHSTVGESILDLLTATPLAQCAARGALAGEPGRASVPAGDAIFDVRYEPMHDAAGQLSGLVSVATDITARYNAEAALAAEGERRAAIIATQRAVTEASLDLDSMMQVIVERTQLLTGATGAAVELAEGAEMVYRAVSGTVLPHRNLRLARAASLSGLCVATGEILRCDDSETDARVDREACRQVGARSMVVVPLQHDRRVIGVLKVLAPQARVFDDSTVATLQLMVGLLSAAMDHALAFEAKQALLAESTHRAHHDALTGLPNRALFFDRAGSALAGAARRRAPLAVLLLDLDGFKQVNDTLGHAAGDALLRVVADRLRATLRASDTIARLGGDEFALLLPDTAEDGAVAAARKVLAALALPVPLEGHVAEVGGSISIALHPAHGHDRESLLAGADQAMYEAKRARLGFVVHVAAPA
jgi:diguanylate cyclase (GGDEF)-like protein/PAS domain S-box-containing protein